MSPIRSRTLGALAAGAAMAVTLAACGGGSPSAAAKSSPTTTQTAETGGGAASRFPGASGEVAAITGTSMEVQNPQSGQVTVNWTSSTVFSQTVTVTASSVAAGDCVTAVGSTATGTLVATGVTITRPDSSGACNNGLRLGTRGGFRGGTPPSSIPNRTLPAGAANFGFASGKVTSVSPTSLVIYGFSRSGFGGRAAGSTSPTSVPATQVTVDVNSATKYTETEPATAADLAVHDCVTATGPADDTGAITARTIRITPAGPQGCTAGFGRGAFAANG